MIIITRPRAPTNDGFRSHLQILSHLNRNHRESPNSMCSSPTYASRSADGGGKHPMENGTNACDLRDKNDFRNELDLQMAHKRTMHQMKPTNLSTKVSVAVVPRVGGQRKIDTVDVTGTPVTGRSTTM